MTITEAEMMNRTFGCELEYEGIGQSTAAKTVAEVTGGTARFVGGSYGTWEVTMPDGRKWKVVSDGSLCGTSSETVTPVMTVADLDTLQKVVRALRRKGAKANSRTGLHVHVGAADFTAENVKNLVRTFYKQEELILKAAGTLPARIERYTQKTDHGFVNKICAMRNPTMNAINTAWFGTFTPHPYHYESHRYHALTTRARSRRRFSSRSSSPSAPRARRPRPRGTPAPTTRRARSTTSGFSCSASARTATSSRR